MHAYIYIYRKKERKRVPLQVMGCPWVAMDGEWSQQKKPTRERIEDCKWWELQRGLGFI